MDGRKNKSTDAWMVGWRDERMDGWMDRRMHDGWVEGWMDGRKNERTDEWMEELKGRWKDDRIERWMGACRLFLRGRYQSERSAPNFFVQSHSTCA